MSDDSTHNSFSETSTAFHRSPDDLRTSVHIVLVEPETGGNVGSIARAITNMGIRGDLIIVGSPSIINNEARKLARNAKDRLTQIRFFASLPEALEAYPNSLSLAATARVGSATRPHPVFARDAIPRAVQQLRSVEKHENLLFVFGREASGLNNEEVAACDWVVTIPSSDDYRSINLAQAVMIFAYEFQMAVVDPWKEFESASKTQRERLIEHFIQLADEVGFILPGDPFKMRSRLSEILAQLPRHVVGVKTLHGLIGQARRSIKAGGIEYKGRYQSWVAEHGSNHGRE